MTQKQPLSLGLEVNIPEIHLGGPFRYDGHKEVLEGALWGFGGSSSWTPPWTSTPRTLPLQSLLMSRIPPG